MQLSITLATLAALSCSVFGTPLASPADASYPDAYKPHAEPLYFLKTVVKFPNPLHRFATSKDNLYVTPYHYGAGLAVALLNPSRYAAYAGVLRNDSQFDIEILSPASFLALDYPTQYENWFPVRYTGPGPRTKGFFHNTTEGLQWNSTWRGYAGRPWQGWLACDWNYGDPQLFWWSPRNERQNDLPTSCDLVNLVMERVN